MTSSPAGISATIEPIAVEEKAAFMPFDFDAEFQSKVAALTLRDDEFLRRTAHILRPEFFENVGEATLVSLALAHFQKYSCAPDPTSLVLSIKEAATKKLIRRDILPVIVEARKELIACDISNRPFVEDKVVDFARRQGLANAIMASVDYLNAGKFAQIEEVIGAAMVIGINEDGTGYDYFERARDRAVIRIEKATGIRPPQGITTGDPKLDALLYHRGWGRKELSVIMGAAKSGKSTALINFARAATLAGYNVLYATLEVSSAITADRFDACISGTLMKELEDNKKIISVRDAIETIGAKSGKLILHEYPPNSLTPNQLDSLIQRYKSPGRNPDGTVRDPIKFDLIISDYLDIMIPNNRTNDPIENSKNVWLDCRAIAFNENVAMLTATQTNRSGFSATVVKADQVSEDINKIRIADIVISINKTEEEAARGEARLFFAASRNQESGFTVVVKQNIAMMRFIESVLRVE